MMICCATTDEWQSLFDAEMDDPNEDSIRHMARVAGLKRRVLKKRMRRFMREALLELKLRTGRHDAATIIARYQEERAMRGYPVATKSKPRECKP